MFGRVQGVGFRNATVTHAKKFPVTGTVANVEDYVEIFVSGDEKGVHAFMERILKGPNMFAKISSHTHEQVPYQDFKQFKQV
ncbi:acylphosphatase [Macrococcus bovicus]|uniref:acylphosphatase n=1 Tax=Macrococcus bovicus TaxID=69968 RepID=UPI0033655BB7|nr:acylphosphatase [Macrococcus bovicus]